MKECICIEDVQQPSSVLVDSLVNPTPTKNFGNTLELSSDLVPLTCKWLKQEADNNLTTTDSRVSFVNPSKDASGSQFATLFNSLVYTLLKK